VDASTKSDYHAYEVRRAKINTVSICPDFFVTPGYAKFRSRSHDAVIRVYNDAGNMIETHGHKGDSSANGMGRYSVAELLFSLAHAPSAFRTNLLSFRSLGRTTGFAFACFLAMMFSGRLFG
jgi:hypothetical protein